MHDHPAGRFAVWATAWLAGRAGYDEALDALLGETAHLRERACELRHGHSSAGHEVDERQRGGLVSGLPETDGALPLGPALSALRGLGERRFRLVLPVPGDVRGLPRAPGLTALALDAGQAAVGERLAFVPEAAGPDVIGWTAVDLAGAPPVPPAPEGSLRAAAGALDLAVRDAARTLAGLDLARWHPEVPALLAGLSKPATAPGLPADHDPLAVSVLARAQRLAAVLDLAMADAPGGAVTRGQAAARDEALRPLADAVREATVAAYNAVPR